MGKSSHPYVNEVILAGRLSGEPRWRALPSGDELAEWLLIVERPPRRRRPGALNNKIVDTLQCVAFDTAVQKAARAWQPGDLVEVRGSLRRRFWRSADGPLSRHEIEVHRAKRLAAATG